MFQGGLDLVFEFLAVNGAATAARASGVASLYHEVGNNAMEDDIVVVASLGEGREVLAGFGSMVVVEFDNDRTLQVVSGQYTLHVQNLTIVVSSTTSVAIPLVPVENVEDFVKTNAMCCLTGKALTYQEL